MTDLRPPVGMPAIERDGTIYIASLPDGPIIVLEGIAAAIWQEACACGRQGLAARVAARLDPPAENIQDEVEAFLVRLIDSGLLVSTSE